MTNKEAIEIVLHHREYCQDNYQEDQDATDIILSLASRMAMYEWWWNIGFRKAEEMKLDNLYCAEQGMYNLDPIDFDRVMKAWKENT